MGTERSLAFVDPLHQCETNLVFLGALDALRSNFSFALLFVIQQSLTLSDLLFSSLSYIKFQVVELEKCHLFLLFVYMYSYFGEHSLFSQWIANEYLKSGVFS